MTTQKTYSVLFLIFLVTFTVFGQEPVWLEEQSRAQNYPSNTYRTGFFSEVKVPENESVISRVKDLAKSDLIESIQVSIKSQSTLKTEDSKAGGFNELFVFETVSLTEQDLVGLEISTYYNKKQKRASAFAFVKTQRLVDYYSTIISSGLEAIKQKQANMLMNLNSGNLNSSIDEAFDARDELGKITHAQSILLALGVKDNQILKTEAVNKNKGEVAEALFKTLSDDRLKAGNLVHFLASSLKENLTKGAPKIQIGKFGYDSYQLYSDLSTYISSTFLSELGAAKNITVINEGVANFSISGYFREVNNRIEVVASLTDLKEKKIVSTAQASVSRKNLEGESIVYLPAEIQRFAILKDLNLTSTPTSLAVKSNEQIDAVYKVKAATKTIKNADLKELPVNFYINTPDSKSTINADEKGELNYIIRSIRSPIKTQFLIAEVNVPLYLKMDPNSNDYKNLTKELIAPKTRLQLNVYGNILYVSSSELNIGQKLSTPYLQSGIVDVLTKAGFEFTENPAKADYNLTINSNTRVGSSYDGLYFSYLDASISLVDTKTKHEVFSNQYQDIKGAGGNFEGAGTKAYSIGVKKIKEDLMGFFLR